MAATRSSLDAGCPCQVERVAALAASLQPGRDA
jgi:hypothetical protein